MPDDVDALLAVARAEYASRLPSKLAAIEELASRGAWDEARRAAHNLSGSAATYGFARIGDAAAVLEQRVADCSLLDRRAPGRRARGAIDEALRRARLEVERAAGAER